MNLGLVLTAIIGIVVGILLAFYGYKLEKYLVIIAAFALGFTLVKDFGPQFITDSKVLLLVEILIGCVFALISIKIEKLAIFLGVTYLVYMAIGAYLPITDVILYTVVRIAIALIVGAIATMYIKPILIVVTGIAGAAFVQQYATQLFSIPTLVITIVTVLIAVFGIIYQFKNN